MANSITRTTSGKYAYENFSGQTDGADATSTEFTLVAPSGQKWIIKTVSGENFIRPSDESFTEINSGMKKTFDAGSICLSQFSYRVGNSSYTNLMRFSASSGNTMHHALQGHRIYFTGGYTNTGIFLADTVFSASYSFTELYTVQSLFKTGRYAFTVWKGSKKVFTTEAPASSILLPKGSGDKWWGSIMGSTSSYIGRALLCAGGEITFNGLTSGMTVNILNADNSVMYSLRAISSSVVYDFTTKEMLPLLKKIQIIGTDGTELLTTDVQTIYGGDVWTYSGDTAGASGGGLISCIGGNIL